MKRLFEEHGMVITEVPATYCLMNASAGVNYRADHMNSKNALCSASCQNHAVPRGVLTTDNTDFADGNVFICAIRVYPWPICWSRLYWPEYPRWSRTYRA